MKFFKIDGTITIFICILKLVLKRRLGELLLAKVTNFLGSSITDKNVKDSNKCSKGSNNVGRNFGLVS